MNIYLFIFLLLSPSVLPTDEMNACYQRLQLARLFGYSPLNHLKGHERNREIRILQVEWGGRYLVTPGTRYGPPGVGRFHNNYIITFLPLD